MESRGIRRTAATAAAAALIVGLSSAGALAQSVYATNTRLSDTPDPTVFGQSVTLTATIVLPPITDSPLPPPPSGTVTFYDGATVIGTGTIEAAEAEDYDANVTITVSTLTVGSHTLHAVYGGADNYLTSDSANWTLPTGNTNPVLHTVNQAATTTALATAPDPSVFGEAKTLTATVTATPPGGGTPTGTVSFFDGATLLGTGTLAAGVATLTTSTLDVGSHSLTAVYAGSADHSGSTSSVDTATVSQTTTTTALTGAPDPSVFGEAKTLTATVTATPPGAGTPTGTVSFFDGATLLGTGTLAGGVATLTTSTLDVGSHSATAVYAGDTSFTGSTSPVDTVTVSQAATSTELTNAPEPSVFGEAKTLTATVTATPPGAGTPTGTVSFFDGATLLGTGTLSAGVATLTTSTLAVGSHTMTAVYSGDASFTGSTSATDTATVGGAATSTELTTAPDPSLFGESKTLTATVTATPPGAGTPTGTVSFFDGATLLGTGTLSAGVATLTTSTLTVGSHSLTAVYAGDASFAGSTSPVDTATINQAATTTALVTAPDPSVFGESKTLSATVTATAPSAGTPTGTVSFFDGATLLGTGTLAAGVATLTNSTLDVGTHSLTAVYAGDTGFTGSTSSVDTVTVNQAGTVAVLSGAPNPSVFGQTVTLTATITVTAPGSGTASGTVSFFDGATLIGTGTLSGGAATLTTSTLAVGSHSLTAVYGGDTGFTGSTSNTDTLTVTTGTTTTALTSSPNPSTVGETVSLTATVTATAPASGTATGTVSFFDGATLIDTASLSDGVATLTTSTLSAGSHSLTAVYGGDASFTGSTSPVATQTVDEAATTTALVSSANPSNLGASVTFTATVAAVAPATGTPTGTVSFQVDSDAAVVVALDGAGQATLTTSSLTLGSHSIVATYVGEDASFAGSTSSTLTQDVQELGTIIVAVETAGGEGTFGFTGDVGTFSVASIAGSGSSTFGGLVSGAYDITADVNTTFALAAIACENDTDSGSVIALPSRSITVDLDPGETITCTFLYTEVTAHTEEIIQNFLAHRANALIQAGPSFQHFVDRFNGTGGTTEDVVAGLAYFGAEIATGNNASFGAVLGSPASRFSVWVDGTYTRYTAGGPGTAVAGDTLLADAGIDVLLGGRMLLGVTVAGDWASEQSDDLGYAISGRGFQLGPYVAFRLTDGLYLDAKLLAGRSWNEVSPFNTYTDEFTTSRLLASARLSGEVRFGRIVMQPGAELVWLREVQHEYVDFNDITIPEQVATTGRLTFGPRIGVDLGGPELTITPSIALEGLWDFTTGELRARVDGGFTISASGGLRLELGAAYDGIGAPSYGAWSARGTLTIPLH